MPFICCYMLLFLSVGKIFLNFLCISIVYIKYICIFVYNIKTKRYDNFRKQN